MVFCKKLFVDEKIDNRDEIISSLEEAKAVFNLYLICVDKKSRNMFDILSSSEYFKEINKNKSYIIVGMAYGRKATVNLVIKIFEWWLDGRGNLDGLKKYFLS